MITSNRIKDTQNHRFTTAPPPFPYVHLYYDRT
jgi:hypothetical protein